MEPEVQEGQIFLMITVAVLVMLLLALAFVAFFYYSQKKLLTEKNKRQMLQIQYQENVLQQSILVQEEERRRIARELHDEIGSKLNAILMQLHQLKKFGNDQPAFQPTMTNINQLIHSTIQTTRQISHDLLPPTLEAFGLVEAIRELADTFNQSGQLQVAFELEAEERPIEDQQAQLHLFRILQELITNSVKHGQARQVDIRLALKNDGLDLSYRDDGKGFDLVKLQGRKDLGMQNIQSRIELIHGKLQIDSSPGAGMLAQIHLN
ncbi:MAG: sensor histidine kinase [Phaeodactylibacter sp.]|nr:sensor histidine kinase [Phaeodactylibacter sp.]